MTQTRVKSATATCEEVALSHWDAVVEAFHRLFDDLGSILQDGSGIAFASNPPDVKTGLQLQKDGLLTASMPLHGMQAKIKTLRWDSSLNWVELAGDELSYTYRIPEELLKHRLR